MAAPTAWRLRKATSGHAPGARPHSSAARLKSVSPPRYRRRWPRRSPSRPKVRSRPLRVSRYAVSTHSMVATSAWKSVATTGSTGVTMCPPRADTNEPAPVAASTHHGDGESGGCRDAGRACHRLSIPRRRVLCSLLCALGRRPRTPSGRRRPPRGGSLASVRNRVKARQGRGGATWGRGEGSGMGRPSPPASERGPHSRAMGLGELVPGSRAVDHAEGLWPGRRNGYPAAGAAGVLAEGPLARRGQRQPMLEPERNA